MGRVLQCVSPIDGTIHAEREALTLEAARAACDAAAGAQAAWAARPLAERRDLVMAGVEKLGEMNDQIVPELAAMMGRPVRYGGEFGGVKERASHMAAIAEAALAPEVVESGPGSLRRVERVARGVVLVVAPWNYPYMTAINCVVPALIAGNAVLLKHATQTLLAGERLASAFHAAGVPEDVFRNVYLDHDTTSALIGEGRFGLVNFTGSVGGGRAMERAAAGTFTPVATELGGKDAGYVRADADPVAAADGLIDGAMFNSGQCCCGIERIYVHEAQWDAFLSRAVEIVEGYRLGDPRDPETTIGPMAHRRFAELARRHVADALAAGARGLIDPAKFPQDDGGAYMAPQILVDVTHDMAVMREETFGPVVGVMKVSGDDEAVRLINDSQFGLTCAIFTRDLDAAEDLAARLEVGTVFANRCDYLDPALCWTGCKETGNGAALGHLGYLSVTRPRSLHFRKG